jgi:uroporphyrinogen decarboxylase
MKSRERVISAFNHIEPDTVPIMEFIYSRPFYKEVLGYAPETYNAEDIMLCAGKIGYDAVVIPFGGVGGFSDNKENTYADEWGTVYQKDASAWPSDAPVGFPVKDAEDLKNYTMPDPNLEKRLEGVKTAIQMNRESEKFIIGNVRGPFSGSWLLTGFENFCIQMYDDEEFIDELVSKVTDFYITGGLRMLEAGVDALLFADDYGSNSAPFMSPAQFAKCIVPHMRRMIDAFKSRGAKVIMHSDGNLNQLLDTIVAQGIDAYHPMERAAGMEISAIKKAHGEKIMLIGNVNNKTTLVTGTVSDVEKEVIECIKAAAPGGGYILASDHSVHDDVPNQNVFAMYEAGRKFGAYPIQL